MAKFTVGIVGGGIVGLALATELVKNNDIQVDIYEACSKIEAIGARITLWGRVCKALRLMGLADDCANASAATASNMGFRLRGFRQPDKDFGALPFKDAMSLRRADLIRILLRRVPSKNIHLGKKLNRYFDGDGPGPVKLRFSDGTRATCDVLIGCDGIRSVTRAQMMRHEAESTGRKDCMRYIEHRWSGTIVYRCLISKARIAAKNPNHGLLSGGQIYLGKNQHIIGYPISNSTVDLAVSITDLSKENTRWPSSSWSACIDGKTCDKRIARQFVDWDSEALDIIDAIESSVGCAVMDVGPLPFYVRGRVALAGDAAHAAVPYVGAGAAFAIEDAYVLSRILSARVTTRESLPLALDAYQAIRLPYGNRFVTNSRLALQEFQYNGPHGRDTTRVKEAIHRIFDETAGLGGSDPEADAHKAISWMEVQRRGSRVP